MNNTEAHQRLVDDLLFEFGSRPDIRLWPRHVGRAKMIGDGYSDDAGIIAYGIAGETDLQGVVAPYGLMIGIEVKTGKGKLSDKQIKWRDMLEKFGAIHIEARSVQQAVEEFEAKFEQWKLKHMVKVCV